MLPMQILSRRESGTNNRRSTPVFSVGLVLLLAGFVSTWTARQTAAAEPEFRVLVFSKTVGYRHASITNGIVAIKQLGQENNFVVEATENSSQFTSENLRRFRVVVFLSTIGDILDESQQTAFQQWLRNGGGLVAVHAAISGNSATEGGWPWYGQLLCTDFLNHPPGISKATLVVEDHQHPSTAHLPRRWERTDEWYNFTVSPRGKARVLLNIDETTFKGGTLGADHPMTWCKKSEGGTVWYTALGHTPESFSETEFLKHLLGGIQVAAGVKQGDWTPNAAPPAEK